MQRARIHFLFSSAVYWGKCESAIRRGSAVESNSYSLVARLASWCVLMLGVKIHFLFVRSIPNGPWLAPLSPCMMSGPIRYFKECTCPGPGPFSIHRLGRTTLTGLVPSTPPSRLPSRTDMGATRRAGWPDGMAGWLASTVQIHRHKPSSFPRPGRSRPLEDSGRMETCTLPFSSCSFPRRHW